MTGTLLVTVEGVPMEAEKARELWQRFSAYMEEHKGDLAGFAKSEGYVSAHPRSDGGKAVLALSRTEAQAAYGPAMAESGPRSGKKKKRR